MNTGKVYSFSTRSLPNGKDETNKIKRRRALGPRKTDIARMCKHCERGQMSARVKAEKVNSMKANFAPLSPIEYTLTHAADYDGLGMVNKTVI